MSGLEVTLAVIAALGVLGVGAELVVRNARRLLAADSPAGSSARPAKGVSFSVVSGIIWLTLGMLIFQEGVWLVYLFLQQR